MFPLVGVLCFALMAVISLQTAKSAKKLLPEMFRLKAMRLYSHFHIWDSSLGNLDDACEENYDEEE